MNVPGDFEQEEIFLPTTEGAFDVLVAELVEHFKLPSAEHCAAVVANRIQHMPPDVATTTRRALGHCVLKNVAYQIAQARSQKLTHQAQVDQLTALLTANPLDQQAWDALDKAVADGSDYALDARSQLNARPQLAGAVIPIKPFKGEEPATVQASPEPA